MGTWVDLTVIAAPARARAAFGDVEAMLRAFERDFYPWADGELAALNRALTAGASFEVSADLAALLVAAQRLSARSRGNFEPGLAPLVELWGFDSGIPEASGLPSDAAIDAAVASLRGIAALEIVDRRVVAREPGIALDLGGIAKGAAVAHALELLEHHGIHDALVNAGGDLAVIGGPAAEDRPWRVGIRHPRGDGLLGIIDLDHGEAAFTSGDYERFVEQQGRRMHHVLDPATGRPVMHTQAVTVISDDPVLADAAATALFVAGPAAWQDDAAALGIEYALRVDASGAIELTDAMAARLEPESMNHDIIAAAPQEAAR